MSEVKQTDFRGGVPSQTPAALICTPPQLGRDTIVSVTQGLIKHLTSRMAYALSDRYPDSPEKLVSSLRLGGFRQLCGGSGARASRTE